MMNLTKSFRSRLAAMTGGLALCLGVTVTIYAGHVTSARLTESGGVRLQEVARSIARSLSDNLRERVRDVKLMSRSPQLVKGDWTSTDVRTVLQDAKDTFRPYAWLGLVDASGEVVAAADGVLEGVDASQRPWFLRGTRGSYSGDVHDAVLLAKRLPPNASGEPLRFIDFAEPVKDAAGNLRGVLGTHIHWTWVTWVVTNAVTAKDAAEGIEVYVLAHDGSILYPYQPINTISPDVLQLSESGHALVTWRDGKRYLTAVERVVAPDAAAMTWRIVLRQPVDKALASVATLRHQLLVVGALATLLFMLLAYRAATHFSRPVERLADIARRIDRGDESLSFESSSSIHELQELERALRGMTARLRARGRELATLNASLEARIAERTAALEVANVKLETLSTTDSLTQIPNRRRFDEVLANEWARATRRGNPVSVLLLDVDRFKQYNDTYGHPAGDECLKQVAVILQSALRRAGEFVARYGGEEFVVVIADADARTATEVAEHIRTAVQAAALPHTGSSLGVVTVSVGAASSEPTPTNSSQELLATADSALYRAKHTGRNRVVVVGSSNPPTQPIR